MRYCQYCGKEIQEGAVVCIHCGRSIEPFNTAKTDPNDAPSTAFSVLGFFIPIIGLVLYLVNMDKSPLKAKSAGKGALLGVIVWTILGIILSIVLSILVPVFFISIFESVNAI